MIIASGYRPFDKQVAFHKSQATFKVATSGNRGGKTVAGAAEFLWNIFRDLSAGKGKQPVRLGSTRVPRLAYWVVTPTSDLGEYPFREIVRFLTPPSGTDQRDSLFEKPPNATTREIWLKGDIVIQFRSTERPERLVAASLNGLWMDEAPRCKAEAWRGGLSARLTDQKGWAIFTGSPFGGESCWLYQDVVLFSGQHGFESFSWTTSDNPHVSRGEIARRKATLPAAWFKRDFEASWQSFGGQIYDGFNVATHTTSEAAWRLEHGLGRDPIQPWMLQRIFRRVIAGVDWGFNSPGAIVVVGYYGDNRFMVLEESYAAGRQILGHGTTWVSEAHRLRDKWGVSLFACDPARPDAIQDFSSNGLPAVGAFNDVYLGIRRVVEALHVVEQGNGAGKPGLRILDQAQHLIAELRSYQWESTKDGGGFLESPAEGQSDHAADALRYAVAELRPYANKQGGSGYGARLI